MRNLEFIIYIYTYIYHKCLVNELCFLTFEEKKAYIYIYIYIYIRNEMGNSRNEIYHGTKDDTELYYINKYM